MATDTHYLDLPRAILRHLVIFGHRVDVYAVDGFFERTDLLGLYDMYYPGAPAIMVDSGLAVDIRDETILHEAIHACCNTMGLGLDDGTEERVANAVSLGIWGAGWRLPDNA